MHLKRQKKLQKWKTPSIQTNASAVALYKFFRAFSFLVHYPTKFYSLYPENGY